jgi:PAS domain S-box-containing protein
MNTLSLHNLERVIDSHPVIVQQEAAIANVVQLMHQRQVDYVLIFNQNLLAGIFTARDLTRMIAAQLKLEQLPITQAMTSKVVTFPATALTDLRSVLTTLRQYHIRHLPLMDEQNRLLGVITPHSIRAVLQPMDLLKLRRVAEVMATQLVVAPLTASMLHISQLMTDHCVSCVVLTETGQAGQQMPVGIVTERDIVRLQVLNPHWDEILAASEMSFPLAVVSVDESLWHAHITMQKHQIRRVVVVDTAGSLAGLITQSSLLKAIDPIELSDTIAALQQVVTQQTAELQTSNQQLQAEITARQQAETNLREVNQSLETRIQERTVSLLQAEERYRTLVDHTPDAMMRFDRQTCLVDLNTACAELIGASPNTLRGTPLAQISQLTPATLTAYQQAIRRVIDAATDVTQDIEHQTQAGQRWMQIRFVPEYDSMGAVKTVLAIARDITPLKQAKADTQRALVREQELNALKDTFIATVSHEFRTPLTVIRMSTELLQHHRDRYDETQLQNRFARILAATEYMTEMMDNFSILSSLMSGQYTPRNTSTDIAALCEELITQQQSLNPNVNALRFSVEPDNEASGDPGETFTFTLDARLLSILLNNLLSNAIKFSAPNSTIHLILSQTSAGCALRLQDQGRGIPAADLPHIWDRFYRASNSSTVRGNGMGLAIVKYCLQYLPGTIAIESQIGEGTTVILQLLKNTGNR